MKRRIANIIKYNHIVYGIYRKVFSFLINLLRVFVRTDEKLILFNSYAGRKYDDSPKEIFMKMKEDARFRDFKLVWALHDPGQYVIEDADVIKTDTFKYFLTALKARVWITNSSVTRGLDFCGKNTFYFNTWHGTPIKYMGTDLQNDESFSLKGMKKVKACDVMCSQGEYETDIFSRTFCVPKENFLECGLPRNDVLANYTNEYRDELRRKFNIPNDKKVILYCPTFREFEKDENYGCVLKPPIDLNKWEANLGNDYVLFFRAHYEVSKVMQINDNEFVKNMTSYPSLNELMIVSDVLISDYSSVYFDYSIMGKTMFHFCYDYDKYQSMRGMYFDIRTHLDGATHEDELISLLLSYDTMVQQEKTIKFRDKYVNFYGNASSACVDYVAKELNC